MTPADARDKTGYPNANHVRAANTECAMTLPTVALSILALAPFLGCGLAALGAIRSRPTECCRP